MLIVRLDLVEYMLDAREEISLCRLEKAGPVAMTNNSESEEGERLKQSRKYAGGR